MILMKNALLSLFVLTVVLAFTACKKNNPAPANTANVMFVNGCAGTNNVDVSVNNIKLTSASNLAFLKSSGYQSITSGAAVPIAFALTATGTPLVNATENLVANAYYSVFAGGLVSGTSTSLVFSLDDLTAPASGMAKVRFVNLSSDNLNLSCYIGSPKIDSNVSIGTVTQYFSIPTATGVNVLFQDPAAPTKLSQLSSQTFSAGKIYTIMLTGTYTGTLTSVLTLTVINNN